MNLREQCLALLVLADPIAKARGVRALEVTGHVDAQQEIAAIAGIPGRAQRPPLVATPPSNNCR